ncbi:MAG: thiolase domain-containing protein [Thermoplasmata archaeon]|nr:thiolase domain-containing protein [Thermoplasmata archaeon]
MRDVVIVGVGQTKYGEHWEKSLRSLVVEAGLRAIEDAGIYSKDIEAIYGGNMSAGSTTFQDHIGPLIADFTGLAINKIPALRIENGSASGAAAFHEGFAAVASGLYDTVLVGGVEKLTDVSMEEVTEVLSGEVDREWELFNGATLASLAALIARRYMLDYNVKREQIALMPVLSHKHGSLNPYAQFKNTLKVEDVLNSTMVADPLTMLDCAPVSDGASAVILTTIENAKKWKKDSIVKVKASSVASDYIALQSRENITRFDSVIEASRKAYKMAKLEPKDISFVEIHDAYSIFGLISLEDLGFFEKGKAGKYLEEGYGNLDSKLPINPSGGLKAKGHPVGATGVGQIVESILQLRKEAEKRQVSDPKNALTLNMGGSGGSAIVHILEVVK